MGQKIKIEVVQGETGPSLYIDSTRVAGGKPWGGGKVIAEWNAPANYLLGALEPYRNNAGPSCPTGETR